MAARLTQQRRVGEEGLRVVKPCQVGRMAWGTNNLPRLTVPPEEAPANSVPAAAVIRRVQALFGITGRKARAGGPDKSDVKAPGSTWEVHWKLFGLEFWRGRGNSRCRGEIRRDREEYQWRRRPSGRQLTLRRESVGSKQD